MKISKLFCAVIATVCLLVGCTFNPMVAIYDNDEKIASTTNSYNLIGIEQTLVKEQFTASVNKMEGMDTIWTFESEEDKVVDITYKINVSSGKMKLVLINPEDEVVTIAEYNSEMSEPVQSTMNIGKGSNRIKIVAAKDTKFDINISISEGEFDELGL